MGGLDGSGFATFLRCGIARSAVNVFTNLSHLEGQKVSVFGNGRFLGFQIVRSGAIVLNEYYSRILVGLPFVSDLETLNIEFQTKEGTLVGRKEKVANVTFRVIKSTGGKIGPNEDKLYEAFTQDALAKANRLDELDDPIEGATAPTLYTTDLKQPLGAEYEGGGNVFYRQVKPYPITVGAIVPETQLTEQNARK